MRLVAACYAVFALTSSVISALWFGCTMVMPFVFVPRGRRERYTMVAGQMWARFVVHGLLWTSVRIQGEMPAGGALLVCNHRSWLDPLLLIARTRSNGLSKKEIWYIPFVGFFGWLSGAVFFDRKNPEERAAAREDVLMLIQSGHRIQLFPEGTRSKDGALREKVYLTLVRDAFDVGVQVVPVAVFDTEQVLPVGLLAAHPGKTVELHIDPPLLPADFEDRDAFAEAAWARVVALVDARSGT